MKGHSLFRMDTQGKTKGIAKMKTCSESQKLQTERLFNMLCIKIKAKEAGIVWQHTSTLAFQTKRLMRMGPFFP